MKPVWNGPLVDSANNNNGVTQSMLQRYLCCPERFRLLVIGGLKEQQEFSHRMEYGSMFHVCEEHKDSDWRKALVEYSRGLALEYSTARKEIDNWHQICMVQFPIYAEHWSKHKDVSGKTTIFREEVFNVPYKLPSGRIALLRGKFDSVDKNGKDTVLQENKIKGDINEEQIKDELPSNIQTMTYLLALTKLGFKPTAVRYNVIRRPLSDWRGKFNIKQKKGRKTKAGLVGVETRQEYLARLGELIKENASHFFMRWRVPVEQADLDRFKFQCLDPILENLCDDYEWWEYCAARYSGYEVFNYCLRKIHFPNHSSRHYRMPFGIYNPLLEGRKGAYADFINTGNRRGLEQVTSLFTELR